MLQHLQLLYEEYIQFPTTIRIQNICFHVVWHGQGNKGCHLTLSCSFCWLFIFSAKSSGSSSASSQAISSLSYFSAQFQLIYELLLLQSSVKRTRRVQNKSKGRRQMHTYKYAGKNELSLCYHQIINSYDELNDSFQLLHSVILFFILLFG